MSSIDERVVELQFDNAQFEAGVHESIGTLDRLKRALNLDSSTKSLSGLTAAGRSFNLDNVSRNVDTIANRFTFLGTAMDQLRIKMANFAISSAKSLVTAIPNQIIEGGKTRAQNLEQAKFQLEGLKIAWEDVSGSIDVAVKDTAYGMDAAAMAASQYAASGVQLGDEMTTALRAISGVAAMTNSSYEDTARVFTTVAGQGRLMGDQLNQLAARGLNVAATLGKAMGKTEAEIREMVSKGQIDFQRFASAMDEAFGEHAKEAEKTFNGALSNVNASLSRMGAQFATPAYEQIRKVLVALKEVFKDVEKIIKPISAKFEEVATSVSDFTVKLLGDIDKWLKKFFHLEDSNNNVVESIENVVAGYENLDEIVQQVIDGLWGNGEERRKALEESGYVFEIIQNGVNEILGCNKRWEVSDEKMTKAQEKLAEAGVDLNKVLQPFDGTLGTLQQNMENVGKTTENQESRLEKLITTVMGFASGLRIVKDAGASMIENVVKPFVSWISPKFLDGVLNFTSRIGTNLLSASGKFNKGFFDAKFKNLTTRIKDSIKSFKNFKAAVSQLPGVAKLSKSIQNLTSKFKELGGGIVSKIAEQFGKIFGKDGIFHIPTQEKLLGIIDKVTGKISNFLDTLGKLKSNPFEVFSGLGKTALDSFGHIFETIATKLPKKIPNIWEILKSAFGGNKAKVAGQIAKPIFKDNKVVEQFLGTPRDLLSGITEYKDGFIKNIKEVFSNINFEEVFNKTLDLLDRVMKILLSAKLAKVMDSISDLKKSVLITKLGSFLDSFGSIGTSISGFIDSWKSIPKAISENIEAMGKATRKDINATAMLKVAAAIAVLAGSLFLISKIPVEDLKKAGIALGGLALGITAIYSAIAFISSKIGKKETGTEGKGSVLDPIADSLNGLINSAKRVLNGLVLVEFGVGLMTIAGGIMMIMLALKMIGKFDVRPIIANLQSYILVLGTVAALAIIGRLTGKGMAGFGIGMLAIGIALQIMISVLKKLNNLDLDPVQMMNSLSAISKLLVVLGLVLAVGGQLGGKEASKFGTGMIKVAGALFILTLALNNISQIPADALTRSTIALDSIIVFLALLTYATGKMEGVKMRSLLALGLVIGELAIIIGALANIPAEQLGPTVIALDSVLLSLAAMMYTISKIEVDGGAVKKVLLVGAILGLLVGAFAIMSRFHISVDLGTVVGMGALVLAVAAVIKILEGVDFKSGAMAAVALIEFIGIFGAAVALLGWINEQTEGDIGEAMKNAVPLFEGVGTALGALIGGLIGGIGGGIATASLLTMMDDLKTFATRIHDFAVIMSEIDTSVFDKVNAIADGIKNLSEAEKSLRGDSLGGYGRGSEGLLNTSSTINHMLNEIKVLAEGMAEVSDSLNGKDYSGIEPAMTALQQMAEVAAVIPNEGGLLGALAGNNNVAKFAEDLAGMAPNLAAVAQDLLGKDFSGVEPAMMALKQIAEAASYIPNEGGVLGDLVGNNNINDFVGRLGEETAGKLVAFAEKVNGKDFKGVKSAMKALKQIANAASTIPNEGGLLGVLAGENNVDKFVDQVDGTALKLVRFADAVTGQDFGAVDTAMQALKTMAETAKTIPNSGGLLGTLLGENDLSDFGTGLAWLGRGIGKFVENAKGVTPEDVEKPIEAVKKLIEMTTGSEFQDYGVFGNFFGTSKVDSLTTFSSALATLAGAVSAIDVDALHNVGDALSDLISEVIGASGQGLTGNELNALSESLSTLAGQGLESFNNRIESDTATVTGSIKKMLDEVAKAVDSKRTTINVSLAKVILSMIKTLNEAIPKFFKAGSDLGTSFALGVGSKADSAYSAGSTLASQAASGAGSKYDSFYKSGQNAGEGFIKGITAKGSAAYKAGQALAKKALQGVKDKDGIDEGSPSKKTTQSGIYFGQGLINGITKMGRAVNSAGASLGNIAVESLHDPLAEVAKIVDGEINVDPTIRPVMDLSGIQNGADAIGGMLGGYNVGVGYLAGGMARRVTAADAVNAINALSGKLSNNAPAGDTYNINGITYDDGSNIADAVKTLTRAARVKRRS